MIVHNERVVATSYIAFWIYYVYFKSELNVDFVDTTCIFIAYTLIIMSNLELMNEIDIDICPIIYFKQPY